MFANPEELLRYLKDEDVKFVDVRFCDLPGVMQHFTTPTDSSTDPWRERSIPPRA